MSLKLLKKKMVEIENEIEVTDHFPDISRLIIPFSVMFAKSNPPDIYTGEEIIPFDEKEMVFKEILIHEFLNN